MVMRRVKGSAGFSAGLAAVLLTMLFALTLAAGPAFAQTKVFAIVPKSLDNPFFADVEAGAVVAAQELGAASRQVV